MIIARDMPGLRVLKKKMLLSHWKTSEGIILFYLFWLLKQGIYFVSLELVLILCYFLFNGGPAQISYTAQ